MGVVEDELVAHAQGAADDPRDAVRLDRARSPTRSGRTASGRATGWETFVARDLVEAIDARYRTIRTAAGRALAGLSEGGYGAINIGLHHPGEFRVLESWSGYERGRRHRLDLRPPSAAPARRTARSTRCRAAPRRSCGARHVYIWFYSGTDDKFRSQNAAFARALCTHEDLAHRFFLVRGGHNWALWRGNAARCRTSSRASILA